ncbi:lytic polysaccharide monooxygenase [Erwinia sp. CGal63]|uniref:lytic polysaccharide monooxygenase n=1 Tax=Erwinia sp. CGal63 TaxID=2919889 RepID=UPI003FA591FD
MSSNTFGAALRHGHIATPASRAFFAWQEGKLNAGQLNQREAGKFFPATQSGLTDPVAPTDSPNALPPRDGEIASANQGDGRFLDEPGTHWKKHTVTANEIMKFVWTYTAPHATRRYNYFITREDWNPNLPLSRAQFESTPFFKAEFTEQPFWSHGATLRPTGPTTHEIQLPQRSGYHVLLAVWEVADTGNAFYQVIDLDFVGNGNDNGNGDTIPAAPASLHATEVTTSSVALAWNASATAGVSYRLYRNGNMIFNGSRLSFVDNGLMENTAYSYTISAVSATGKESAQSAAVIVTTKSSSTVVTPPTAPVRLHSMSVTADSASLMWGSSEGSNPIASYIIYREGDEIARVAASQLNYTDRGLRAETTYRYFVAAVDSQDLLSVPSNVLTVTTLANSSDDNGGNDDNGQYPAWRQGGSYTAGEIVSHNGKNWVCIQSHTAWAIDWAPGLAETLWYEAR